jgi:spore germination cell wall hydrolase CwlJ-like protein
MKKLILMAGLAVASNLGAANDVIAKTIYAEARGEGRHGMKHVASVIYNRGRGDAEKCVKACLKPYQFSCWNGKSDIRVNRNSREWRICLEMQENIESGNFKPLTTAKHYYANTIKTPKWARGCKHTKVGNHFFVEGVER